VNEKKQLNNQTCL